MSNSYLSSSLTFHSDKITCVVDEYGDEQVEIMMDWEHPIMSASAAYITRGGGDILEIGFGMGIASGYIQSHSISSHTIIDPHPQIVEKAVEWANDKSNVTIISQSWADVTGSLGTYDGIFYDTDLDDTQNLFSSSLSDLTKSGTKFTVFNGKQSETNIYNINMDSYQQINVNPPVCQYFPSGSKTYYMPMKEF
jgi:predicted O-methyltransferase YrrM